MKPDAGQVRRHLNAIRTVWDHMLPDAPKATLRGTVGRNTGATALPGPVPVTTLDVRAQTRARLAGWCLVVISDLDLHPRLDGQDVDGMCRFLDTHADHLAGHEAADDVLEELGDSADRCVRIAEPPGALQFIGRCDVCRGDLRARDGGRGVCRDCGNVVDAEATRERARREAEDKILPASEIVTLSRSLWDVRVEHHHLVKWVGRGRLTPAGRFMDDDGTLRDGYRVKDVSKLAAEMAVRRSA